MRVLWLYAGLRAGMRRALSRGVWVVVVFACVYVSVSAARRGVWVVVLFLFTCVFVSCCAHAPWIDAGLRVVFAFACVSVLRLACACAVQRLPLAHAKCMRSSQLRVLGKSTETHRNAESF